MRVRMRSAPRAGYPPGMLRLSGTRLRARSMVSLLAATALISFVWAPAASAGVGDQGRPPRVVTIITGQRVLAGTTADGIATARVIPSSDPLPRVPLTVARVAGDDYVIPASAQPYLRRYLDVNLFDVTKLAAAGITNRVPLLLTYQPGTRPAIPGVTITSSGGGVAHGYVTTSSAQQFGTALSAQAYVDQQAGWPKSSPLFGSVTSVAPDIALPVTVTPDFPMVTLIIDVLSRTGKPIRFGFGFLFNQDDGRKYEQFIFVVKGEARVSVPLGNYMGVFDDWSFGSDGSVTFRVMPVISYRVSAAGQTLTVDARNATVSPTITTPQPSVAEELDVTLDFADEAGNFLLSWGYGLAAQGSSLLIEPAAAPSIGSLSETTRWIRVDPTTPGGSYLYDATYVDPGVPADQAHSVPGPAGTAQIDATYLADHLNALGATLRLVLIPKQFFAFAISIPLPMPAHRTEYVLAPKNSILDDIVLQNLESFWDPGWFEDPAETVVPGTVRSATWLRNPFAMGVVEPTAANKYPTCLACRSSDRMTFVMFPQDGDPTHIGFPFAGPHGHPVAHFSVYLDGIQILTKTNRLGAVFKVPSTVGTYRVVNDLRRRLTGSLLSTHLHSEVTFRSGAGAGAPLPSGWYCLTGSRCTVLPVLTESIDLNAAATGTLPLGTSTFDLVVGHIEGSKNPAIRSVTVSIRRSGSSNWAALPVSIVDPGRYQASFKALSGMAGQTFDLRVTATDAKGGALIETTTRAFRVSA